MIGNHCCFYQICYLCEKDELMELKAENPILPFKIQELVDLIMKNKHLSFIEALFYLYSSNLYESLFNEPAKWWYLSSLRLYDMLKEEKRENNGHDSKTNFFVIFCVESYKELRGMSVKEVFSLFTYYDVFDYLTSGYEVLHTQGKAYIAEDIDIYIKNRKKHKL